MKCKSCKNTVPDGSVFCMYCGARLIQVRDEIKVPAPQLRSGSYWGRVTAPNGARISVTEPTEAKYYAAARAIKTGKTEIKKAAPGKSLEAVCSNYLNDMEAVLSPSTIRGYFYANKRLTDVAKKDIEKIDWQKFINDLTIKYAPRTVENTWGFIVSALTYAKAEIPDVHLPTVVEKEEDFLDYEEILLFLAELPNCKSKGAQIAALLALHSLRTSEILALNADSVKDGIIHVRGAIVRNKSGELVYKEANKTSRSRRDIPVMIPMLTELWDSENDPEFPYPTNIYDAVLAVCRRAGVRECSMHDLRRSFASLGVVHLKMDIETVARLGGWEKNSEVLRKIYVKLSEKDKQSDIDKMKEFFNGNNFGTDSEISTDSTAIQSP